MTLICLYAGATYWTVPTDFQAAGATIECVGCGGNGANGVAGNRGGGGGQGGGYAKITSPAHIRPNDILALSVGHQGTVSSLKDNTGTIICQADYGRSATTNAGGAGTQNNIGDITFSGGIGGDGGATSSSAGGGGGGAAGPSGAGKAGAAQVAGGGGAGGGGANGGLSTAGSANIGTTGGAGGQGTSGAGSGVGGSPGNSGGVGTLGGGGGGAGQNAGATNFGGAGGGDSFSPNHGAGGGGGGGGSGIASNASGGGAGGHYGGGGGGGGNSVGNAGNGGNGYDGVVIINYTPLPLPRWKKVDRARETTPTTGTGTLTLGPAATAYRTFAAAGVADGDNLEYLLEDGTAWEIGIGTYGSAGPTLTRTLRSSSTGSLLNLSGKALVAVIPTSSTFLPMIGGTLHDSLQVTAAPGGWSSESYAKNLLLGGCAERSALAWLPSDTSTNIFAIASYNGGLVMCLMPPLNDSTSPSVNLWEIYANPNQMEMLMDLSFEDGSLYLDHDPVSGLEAATKNYVDGKLSSAGIPDAPSDGTTYGRMNSIWSGVLPISGGVLTGPLTLAADPAVPLAAATQQYVDAQVSNAIGASGASALIVYYNARTNNILETDPGSGNMEWNTNTQSDASQLYVSKISNIGNDLTTIWQNSIGARIAVQKKNDSTVIARYTLNSIGDHNGWLTLNVTPISSSGLPFGPNTALLVAIVTSAALLPLAGGTMTGNLILAADPTTALMAATKQYTDARAWKEAPTDGSAYLRANSGWFSGGTVAHNLAVGSGIIPGTASDGNIFIGRSMVGIAEVSSITFGAYLDTVSAWRYLGNTAAMAYSVFNGKFSFYTAPVGIQNNVVPFTLCFTVEPGIFTMSPGTSLVLSTDPTTGLQAATKQYVDNKFAAGVISFNTRTGAVVLNSTDVTTALGFTPYNSTNPSGYQTSSQVVTALAAGNPGAFSTLSASGTVSGAGFTALLSPYALTSSVPVASSTTPSMDGTATIGVGTTWARSDHVHPVDTSRYAASNPSGYQTSAQVVTALAAGSPGAFSTLSASGTVSGAGFTSYLASPPAIGATAANTGAFTTLSASGTVSGAGFTSLLSPYALTSSVPVASSTTPIMDSAAAIGVGTTWARADHVHPTDTSRYAASNPSGYQTSAQVVTAIAAGNPGAFSTLSASGTVSGAGFTTLLSPYALLTSPTFTGTPTLPTGTIGVTQIAGTNNTSLATTAFVTAAITAANAGVSSFNTRTGAVVLNSSDVTTALGFTPYNSTNPSGYQTSAQVVTALAAGNPGAFSTLSASSTVSGAGFTTLLSPYALLASPTFSGTPSLPTGTIGVTQTSGTNNTSLATTAYVIATRLDQFAAPNIDVGWNSHRITGLLDPSQAQDAATKNYVDATAQGLVGKAAVRVATTGANITLSATQTIDGVAVIVGDRVLVKDQTSQPTNGIYVVAAGAWTRATDTDTWNELVSAYTFVSQGTVNADNGFLCTVDQGGTLGTTAVTWVQFSGAGQVLAGGGLTKTGNQLDVVGTAARIAVFADNIDIDSSYVGQASITTLGTVATGTWNATTVAVAKGGTGATSLTNNAILLGGGTNPVAPLASGSSGQFLTSAGAGNAPAWQAAPVLTITFGTTGLTPSSATSGAVTVAGILNVANGGTGATTLTGYVKGSGTSPFTASATIPNTDITGLGTMAIQNASAVAITGGTLNSVSVGATTTSTGAFTTLSASGAVSGAGFTSYLASPPAIGSTTANTGAFTTLTASGTVSGAGFTSLLSPYALTSSVPVASSTTPIMDSAAAIGVGTTWARADHVHPTDTSRYAASNPSGYQTAAQVTTSLGAYVPLTGGTLTGTLRTTNTYGYYWTDVSGTTPGMFLQSDNNWIWNGTNAAGANRVIAAIYMRNDTSRLVFYPDVQIQGFIWLSADPTQPLHATTKQYVDGKVGNYVARVGDTMSGPLHINASAAGNPTLFLANYSNGANTNWPAIVFDQQSTHRMSGYFESDVDGLPRWSINFGDAATESGGNVGTNFSINRFSDTGQVLSPQPLAISRATGTVTILTPLMLAGDPTANLQAATKQYVDSKSSSVAISDTAPATPSTGSLWFDSVNAQLYIRYADADSSQWVVANNTFGLTESPIDGTTYGRNSGSWIRTLADAPNDGTIYGRMSGTWTRTVAGAPSDGKAYSQRNAAWTSVPFYDANTNVGINLTPPSPMYSGSLLASRLISAVDGFYVNSYTTNGTDWVRIATGGASWIGSGLTGNVTIQTVPSGAAGSTIAATVGNFVFDNRGNFGIGVTPPAGQSVPILANGGGWSFQWGTTLNNWANNAYFDGTNWRYIATGYAWNQQMTGSQLLWQAAPSGTAGAIPALATLMTLTSAGTLTTTGAITTTGIHFGSVVAPGGNADFSRHIDLWGGTYGFTVTSSQLNHVASVGASNVFYNGTNWDCTIGPSGAINTPGSISASGSIGANGQVRGGGPTTGSYVTLNSGGVNAGYAAFYSGATRMGYIGFSDGNYMNINVDGMSGLQIQGPALNCQCGIVSSTGRLLSRNSNNNPSVCCYNTGAARANGFITDNSGNFVFCSMQADATYAGQWFYVNVSNGYIYSSYGAAFNGWVSANGVYASSDQSFYLASNVGSGRILNWTGGYYLDFNWSNGTCKYVMTQDYWWMRNDWVCYNGVSVVGGIGAYQNYSDERGKRDVAPAMVGLREILLLNPIRFRRLRDLDKFSKAHPPPPDNEEIGFSAQQVRDIIPEAVMKIGIELPDGTGGKDSDNPTLSLGTDAIVAALVNAIKELAPRIEALEGIGTNFDYGFGDGMIPRVPSLDTWSDRRLKQDIRDSNVDALGVINSIPMRSFSFLPAVIDQFASMGKRKEEVGDGDIKIGFISQELQQHIPEAVYQKPENYQPEGSPMPDDTLLINQQQIVPYLVKSIQQLTDRIAILEGAIAS